jgi:succinate dehydrogenase / fumarate reductase cytochrome b subunit
MTTEGQTLAPERRARRPGVAGWFDPRGRRMGAFAFMLNRLTGLGLVLYLYLHLFVLSNLARGAEAWDGFVDLVLSPPFLALDVLLLAGMLIHGLNGIRVGLVGLGMVESRQKALFISLMVVAAIVLLAGALRIFSTEG